MTATQRAVAAASGSLLAVATSFVWSMLAPNAVAVGCALVSMGCLAASLHAIGRTHPGS